MTPSNTSPGSAHGPGMSMRTALWDAFVRRLPPPLLVRLVALHYRRMEPETRCLRHLVHGGVALDIGANYGVYSLLLARAADEVHAFEPNPSLWNHLARALPSNVHLHRFGLSDTTHRATLRVPYVDGRQIHGRGSLTSGAHTESTAGYDIELKRLDDMPFSNVQFIKIDVEGHEVPVLEGGKRLLQDWKPHVLMEWNVHYADDRLSRLLHFMKQTGYACWFIETRMGRRPLWLETRDGDVPTGNVLFVRIGCDPNAGSEA